MGFGEGECKFRVGDKGVGEGGCKFRVGGKGVRGRRV